MSTPSSASNAARDAATAAARDDTHMQKLGIARVVMQEELGHIWYGGHGKCE